LNPAKIPVPADGGGKNQKKNADSMLVRSE
jgi:hypothetical protein